MGVGVGLGCRDRRIVCAGPLKWLTYDLNTLSKVFDSLGANII